MNSCEGMELRCIMCEETCKKHEMPRHKCLKGYRKFFIDAKSHYFYPMLEDGKTIIRRSLAVDDDVLVKQENWNPNTPDIGDDSFDTKTKSNFAAKKGATKKLTEAETHLLITEIQKRSPLWDFSLPIDQRNKDIKQKLWEEVSEKLDGKLCPKEVQTKFKCLRDTHRKIIQTELQANNSTKDSHPKWKHYEEMEFLRSSCMIKTTEANVSQDEIVDNDSPDQVSSDKCTIDDDDNLPSVNKLLKRRRKNSYKEVEDSQRALNKTPETVCNNESMNIVLPPPPQPDEVDSILHAVGLLLRKIPYTNRIETLIDVMRIVSARVAEQNIQDP